jgi:reverse gyrase
MQSAYRIAALGGATAVVKPYSYQRIYAARLAQLKVALLLLQMGFGKSAFAILAADLIGARRILIRSLHLPRAKI